MDWGVPTWDSIGPELITISQFLKRGGGRASSHPEGWSTQWGWNVICLALTTFPGIRKAVQRGWQLAGSVVPLGLAVVVFFYLLIV